MPAVSERQRRAMYAAAEGKSRLGIPEKVGKEFVGKDAGVPNTNAFGSLAASVHEALNPPGKSEGAVAVPLAKPIPTELDIARAIQSGILPSPQTYENLHLFDVRITGTGTSYRQNRNEYVYRSPDEFLSDDFVERCNGLPVIFEHPRSGLNTQEYRNRAIGIIVLPYVRGSEVWGIAKIYDADAAELMQNTHASTSPSVVFRDANVNEKITMGNGEILLIEGKPSYLDHLAICEAGVWDKGGEPTGVSLSEETAMADEERIPAWADAMNKRFDAFDKRFDALESKAEEEEEEEEADARRHSSRRKDESGKKETQEEKEDKKDRKDAHRKDGEEAGKKETEEGEKKLAEANKEEKKTEREENRNDERLEKREREDSARADAGKADAEMKAKIAEMERRLATAMRLPTNEERDAIAQAYARADSVARMLADEVTHALPGENPIAYRKRLAAKFQKFSPTLKEVKLDSIDGAAFDHLERQIYADAQAAALSPAVTSSGRLIPIYETNPQTGQRITRWAGDMSAWMDQFSQSGTAVRLTRPNQEQA